MKRRHASEMPFSWCSPRMPIPGTRRRRYLEDNIAASNVMLDGEDLARLGALEATGDRYTDMASVRGDTKTAQAS